MSDNYPSGIVETKIGKIRVMANGRNTLYVSTATDERSPEGLRTVNYATVRGVSYSASLNLEDLGNGAGYQSAPDKHGNTYNALYCSRVDHGNVSTAGRNTLTEVMTAAALEWVKANPTAPILAGIHEEKCKEDRLMDERIQLESKLAKVNDEIMASRARATVYKHLL
jgi:hypothetical protein